MEYNEEYNDESNFLDNISVLLKNKILIIVIVSVSVCATGIISILSPKIYRATAVIIPANQSTDRGSMSAIASQFGIATARTSNISEIISLLNSNILMERIIKNHNLLPVLLDKNTKNKPGTDRTWSGIRSLKGIVSVNHKLKEGVVEISAEYKDPKIVANLINHTLTELTNYMSSEAKRVANTNKDYLESLIDKNADPLIKKNIYLLIARQIEISMLAEVKENFAFKILDPPKVPDMKIRPTIRKNVILSFIISLFAGVSLAFFLEYLKNLKETQRSKD